MTADKETRDSNIAMDPGTVATIAKGIVELIGNNEELARQVQWELTSQFGQTADTP